VYCEYRARIKFGVVELCRPWLECQHVCTTFTAVFPVMPHSAPVTAPSINSSIQIPVHQLRLHKCSSLWCLFRTSGALLLAKASGRQVLPGADILYLIELSVVRVVPVCWLSLLVLRLIWCCFCCFRVHELAFLRCCLLCLLSASLSIVTACKEQLYACAVHALSEQLESIQAYTVHVRCADQK
jgi:hypothetical protein